MPKEPVLAVDLGSTCLKVARLGEGGKVISCDLAPLSHPTSEDIKSRSRQDGLVVDALRALVQKLGPGRFETVSMVSGRSVYVRRLKILQMTKAEMDKSIRFEARTSLPFPVSEAVLDYLVIRKFEEVGVKKQEVLLFAVPRKALEEHLAILRRAGLDPVAVDIGPFAYLRFFNKYYPGISGKTFAYIDLGGEQTEITAFKEDSILFSRTIALGGKNFTQAVADELGVSREEAESLKREFGHPLKMGQESPGKGAKSAQGFQAHEAVAPLYIQLITDLKRSLEYFGSQFPEANIERIYLGGGLANAAGIEQFIGQNLEIACEKVGAGLEVPLAPVSKTVTSEGLTPRTAASWFIGCFGLASWWISPVKINLATKRTTALPIKEKAEPVLTPRDRMEMKKAASWIGGLFLALLLGLFGYGFYLNHQISRLEGTLTEKKAELAVLTEERKKLEEEKLGKEGRLAEYKELFEAIQKKTLMTSELVDDLALVLPADVALTNLEVSSRDKKFSLSAEASSRAQIEKLLARIEEYPSISNYQLSFIRSGSLGDYLNQSFQITGTLR